MQRPVRTYLIWSFAVQGSCVLWSRVLHMYDLACCSCHVLMCFVPVARRVFCIVYLTMKTCMIHIYVYTNIYVSSISLSLSLSVVVFPCLCRVLVVLRSRTRCRWRNVLRAMKWADPYKSMLRITHYSNNNSHNHKHNR